MRFVPGSVRLKYFTSTYSFWWFECYEMVRKLMLCGLLIFVMPESTSQVAIGCLLSAIGAVIHVSLNLSQTMRQRTGNKRSLSR